MGGILATGQIGLIRGGIEILVLKRLFLRKLMVLEWKGP